MKLTRPHLGRIALGASYSLATAGLLILATDGVLFDEWAIVGAAVVTLIALAALMLTGEGWLYLIVGGAWLYATVIEAIRGPTSGDRAGLALVFLALAVGALAAYTAYRREAPLRV